MAAALQGSQYVGSSYPAISTYREITLNGVTSGNCLVFGVGHYTGGANVSPYVGSVTEMVNSRAFTLGTAVASNLVYSSVWYLLNAPAGTCTVRVTTYNSLSSYFGMCLAEFSGVANSGQPRATASTSQSTNVTSVSLGAWSSAPSSGDLMFTAQGWANNYSSLIVPSGLTSLYQSHDGTNEACAFCYGINNGTNPTYTWSWTSADRLATTAVALKQAVSSGSPSIGPQLVQVASSGHHYGVPQIGSSLISTNGG